LSKSFRHGGNRVVDNGRVVLANVVIPAILLVDPSKALKAAVWHVLLVETPANLLLVEEIKNSGNVVRNLVESIVCDAEVVTANGCNVIWLARMGDTVILREGNALTGEL